jgi:hypothetical protein
MALFNSAELYRIGNQITISRYRTAEALLKESFSAYKSNEFYDIFLSHSYRDKNVILGLKDFIEKLGYSVYIDWLVDTQLDRTDVRKDTAKILKDRMKNCKCLFFAFSMNSPNSVWMPWELGIFDGINGKAAILPINDTNLEKYNFEGQEYLALYPYIGKDNDTEGKMRLWVIESADKYITFDGWLRGVQPCSH